MAAKKSRKSAGQHPASPVTEEADGSSESGETLSPDELARALRAMAAELERDPALARRVAGAMRSPTVIASPQPPQPFPGNTSAAPDAVVPDEPGETEPPVQRARRGRTFTPRLVTGNAPTLGQGVPDPFALRLELGEEGLRAALEELRLGTLRAIVREYHLDPKGQLSGQNDDAKFRALILRATKATKHGNRS